MQWNKANKRTLVRVVPNKTVLFHTSENGDVSVYVQRTGHKGAPHVRSEVDFMQRYRGTHYEYKGTGYRN